MSEPTRPMPTWTPMQPPQPTGPPPTDPPTNPPTGPPPSRPPTPPATPGGLRSAAFGLLALVLVVAVLGVQRGRGGGEFEPLQAADPCVERDVVPQADGIDGLTEQLVLIGLDGAGCELGVGREALVLELARSGTQTDEQIDAIRAGLLGAVERLEREDELPDASDLADEALDGADLNRFLEAAIRALPDKVVNGALQTDDVLTRAIEDLDLRKLLANLDDEDELNNQIEKAVTDAVKDALLDKLKDLGPG